MKKSKSSFLMLLFMYMYSLCSLWPTTVSAADISREPLQGYWVGYVEGKYVNTLFQNWKDAAIAQCGGRAEFVHPSTTPPSSPKGPPANVYCYYSDLNNYHWVNSAFWMDACPDWQTPYLHDPSRTCTTTNERPPCSCDVYSDPVIFSTRSMYQVENDYKPAHRLSFSTFYNSGQPMNQLDSMSPTWRHSYSRRLYASQYASTIPMFSIVPDYHLSANGWYPQTLAATPAHDYADVMRPDGFSYHFTSFDGGKVWAPDVDVHVQLEALRDTESGPIVKWKLTDENSNVSFYSADGLFIEMQYFHGSGYILTYSDVSTPANIAPKAGLLIGVMDNFHHSLNFQYDNTSRLVKMLDAAANIYSYSYDSDGNLVSVTYPDLAMRLYHYDEPENSANSSVSLFKGLLTGISEQTSNGDVQRISTIHYSARDPLSTEHAGGVDKFNFDYSKQTVTTPKGNVFTLSINTVLGHKVVTDRMQPDQNGTGQLHLIMNYDAAGNVGSRIGLDGTMTCFQYEPIRNLESARIEGASSVNNCTSLFQATALPWPMRKTTTVWHETLKVPVIIGSPLNIQEMAYDSAGNMLTQISTSTLDATGVSGIGAQKVGRPRTLGFTYDINGNVLTAKGARTDIDDTTRYSYDESGNLATATNPLGQTTIYSGYDANGRPGRIIEPTGLLTDFTYDLRGRLLSRAVTRQGLRSATSFAYDDTGNFIKITLPDGSYFTYVYDLAHRLTDVRDNVGNSIHYTLDNAGNQLQETVIGDTGKLARQTTRIFDALNQLQQQTGGEQ